MLRNCCNKLTWSRFSRCVVDKLRTGSENEEERKYFEVSQKYNTRRKKLNGRYLLSSFGYIWCEDEKNLQSNRKEVNEEKKITQIFLLSLWIGSESVTMQPCCAQERSQIPRLLFLFIMCFFVCLCSCVFLLAKSRRNKFGCANIGARAH